MSSFNFARIGFLVAREGSETDEVEISTTEILIGAFESAELELLAPGGAIFLNLCYILVPNPLLIYLDLSSSGLHELTRQVPSQT